jgi:2-(1,2-epoxy-1,2-dihydrophenyl)acetyl-CoA isomerase
MSAPHVLAEVKDGIGWITLNRPESLNALSMEMRDLLIEHSADFENDPAVRCVVIRGAGTHFMAGGDIRGFHKSLSEEKEAHLAGFEMRVVKAHQAIYQIRRMNKPVLASVQGAAAGFGLSLILNCDLAIASDDAFFTLAYRHIGLSADGGATYFLPRVVGDGRRWRSPCSASASRRRRPRTRTSSTGSCPRISSPRRPGRWRASSPTARPSRSASPSG